MKTQVLEEGKVFKNHQAMCGELGLVFKNNTNSKKANLKELSRFCKWYKSGHSIVIDEVYEMPLPYIENRGRHKKKTA